MCSISQEDLSEKQEMISFSFALCVTSTSADHILRCGDAIYVGWYWRRKMQQWSSQFHRRIAAFECSSTSWRGCSLMMGSCRQYITMCCAECPRGCLGVGVSVSPAYHFPKSLSVSHNPRVNACTHNIPNGAHLPVTARETSMEAEELPVMNQPYRSCS